MDQHMRRLANKLSPVGACFVLEAAGKKNVQFPEEIMNILIEKSCEANISGIGIDTNFSGLLKSFDSVKIGGDNAN